MMFQSLSDDVLISQFTRLVKTERKITALVLDYIREVGRRRLYLVLGYGSLFEFLTRAHGYSESAAYRRIQAARMLAQTPDVKESLEKGEVTLSTLAKVQSHIHKEERRTGESLRMEERIEIFEAVKNCTTVQVEQVLHQKLPEASEALKPKESERRVSAEATRLTITLSNEQLEKLKRVRDLASHGVPDGDWAQVIECLTDAFLKRRDPLLKTDPVSEPVSATPNSKNKRLLPRDSQMTPRFVEAETALGIETDLAPKMDIGSMPAIARASRHKLFLRRPIPASTKRFVLRRDRGQCQWPCVDGGICGSTYQIELDHIREVASGGDNEAANLRVICRAHNAHRNWMKF